MKHHKIFLSILTLFMLSLLGCQDKQPAENHSENQEAEKNENNENIISEDDENNIVWRPCIPAPFTREEMQPVEDEWESAINGILEKENKAYRVTVDFLYESHNSNNMIPLDFLKDCRDKKLPTDVISVSSGMQDMSALEKFIPMYKACSENGIFLSLDEWLNSSQGENVKAVIPEADFQNAKIDGVTYGLSAVLPQIFAVAYSKDVLDQCGIVPEDLSPNLFENEAIFQKVKDMTGMAPYRIFSADAVFYTGLWLELSCLPLGYDANHGFVNVLELPDYQNYMKQLFDWKQKGLLDTSCDKKIPPDGKALAVPFESLGLENYRSKPYELVVQNGKLQETLYVVPSLNAPFVNPYWGDNKVCIASWTTKKEFALDFMEQLLTNPEIANFLQFGVEDHDYIINDKGQVQRKQNIQQNIMARYFGYQYTNPLITMPTETMEQDKLSYAESFHEKYEKNLPRGFRLDILPIAQKIKAVNDIYKPYQDDLYSSDSTINKLLSLTCENVEETIKELIGQMKAAGMDDILKEANQQLEEWKK